MTVVNVPHHSHIVVPSVAVYALGPQVVQSRVRAPGPAWERLLVCCHDRASIPHPRCPPSKLHCLALQPGVTWTTRLAYVTAVLRLPRWEAKGQISVCSKCPPVPDLTSPCPAASSARQGSSHLSAAAAYLSVGSISLPFSGWGGEVRSSRLIWEAFYHVTHFQLFMYALIGLQAWRRGLSIIHHANGKTDRTGCRRKLRRMSS